jgi:hypothetical protein
LAGFYTHLDPIRHVHHQPVLLWDLSDMSISLSLAPLSIVFSLRVRFAVCHTSFYTDSALIAVFAQPIPPGKTAAASTI